MLAFAALFLATMRGVVKHSWIWCHPERLCLDCVEACNKVAADEGEQTCSNTFEGLKEGIPPPFRNRDVLKQNSPNTEEYSKLSQETPKNSSTHLTKPTTFQTLTSNRSNTFNTSTRDPGRSMRSIETPADRSGGPPKWLRPWRPHAHGGHTEHS